MTFHSHTNYLIGFLLLFCWQIFAAKPDSSYVRSTPSINIFKTSKAVKIDGILNDEAWQVAEYSTAFHQSRPYDSSYAVLQTKVKVSFDDKFFYVAAICYEPKASYTVSSLKRDFEGGSSDVFTVNLDTFHDRLNGFQFALSPLNVQREGLLTGSDQQVSTFWDNIWYSAVKNYEDRWELEIAIPFKTLRYKVTEQNVWGLNFGRNTLAINEISTWSPVPRNFPPSSLAFGGNLLWNTPPPSPTVNISLIPFLAGRATADFARNPETLQRQPTDKSSELAAGMDAKIGIGPSLNLDLTVNPDFSNVEVDRQVANLSRFELFFPERRQFFLENNDLFGTFGFPDTRPFFTRRLGIAYNPTTGQNAQVGILAGARLSGKLNNNLRIGLMNLQTKKVDFGAGNKLPASNYTVAILQQKILKRSTIGAIFVNKSSNLSDFSEQQQQGFTAYNRVAGIELNLNSADNKFESETYFHQSFSPKKGSDATSFAHFMGFHHPNANINLALMRIGDDYRAETGFVPRPGIFQIYRPVSFSYYPTNAKLSKVVNSFEIGMYENSDVFDLKGKALEHSTNVYFAINSPTGANFFTGWGWQYTYLFFPFDPTNAELNPNPDRKKDIIELPVGGYKSGGYFFGYESAPKNNLGFSMSFDTGKFFNDGNSTTLEMGLSYRVQPIGNFGVELTKIDIKQAKPYNSANYWLVGPRAELSFSKSLFFSSFFQYNTQTNNFNINSRLQWRFKPVSDIFLVYTDNRFAQQISNYGIKSYEPKNRALVFKMTYWFNL